MVVLQRLNDTIIVTLPTQLCFYEARARDFLEELGKIADDLHRISSIKTKGVLLLQEGPASDWHTPWLLELGFDCMFNDLVHRIDTWRWLLSLIRNSPVPWIYAAADDCRGSSWELALCCQRRYWYKSQSLLGFPEISAGAFPPGGVLESLNKRTGRTRERWQLSPYYTAREALDDGLVDFCSDAREWRERATSMFFDMLRLNPSTGVRELRRKRLRNDFVSVNSQSRRAAYEQIENVWRLERVGGASGPSAWDYCWQLVKERAKLKQPGDLGRLICLIASRYLLSPAYSIWLQSNLVAADGTERKPPISAYLPPIIIDLNQTAPPVDVLVRLLQASVSVVFATADSRDLMAALNLQFSRLERALGSVAAQTIWERGVSWYQGRCDQGQGTVLRWTLDDWFTLSTSSKELRFLRIEGNGPNAKAGLLEWPSSEHESLTSAEEFILGLVADSFLRTGAGLAITPVSTQIRSLFLDEMLRVCRHSDGDVGIIAESLRASGWNFAGDEEAWDRFLRTRQLSSPFGTVLEDAPRNPPSNWDLTSWRHAKIHAKRAAGAPLLRWNTTAISQHFALFLGLLAELTASRGEVRDRHAADYLSAQALGIPSSYGTPLTFLRLRGRRRVEHYAALQWPRLQLPRTQQYESPK